MRSCLGKSRDGRLHFAFVSEASNSLNENSSVDGDSQVARISLNNSIFTNSDRSFNFVLNVNQLLRSFILHVGLERLLEIHGLFSV